MRDFSGKVPPMPCVDAETLHKYCAALQSRDGKTVEDCLSRDCSSKIKKKMAKKHMIISGNVRS